MDHHSPKQLPLPQIRGLFDKLAAIQNEDGRQIFRIKQQSFQGPSVHIHQLSLSATDKPDAGFVRVRVDIRNGTVAARGPAAICDSFDATVQLVTRWAAGFVTEKDQILTMDPAHPAPQIAWPSGTEVMALLADKRARTPSCAISPA